jgi:hypothetical protein
MEKGDVAFEELPLREGVSADGDEDERVKSAISLARLHLQLSTCVDILLYSSSII